MLELFISSFITMFVIVDPLGTSAVYTSLTSKVKPSAQKAVALRASIIATVLLALFGLVGAVLLSHMGITLDAFRIAGGFLLSVTAYRMIMGFHDSDSLASDDSCYKDVTNIAIFPLAIPLLAGPGCMTAMILNINEADNIQEKSIVIVSMILVQVIAFVAMLAASKISKIMSPSGASLIARLMGVLLAAMSVQFIADGVISIMS